MSRTERLLALAEHLRGRRTGTTAAALADRFNVTERTIYRDLGALRAAHLPIEGERGRGGGLKLDHHYTLPPVNFTPREGALLVACGEWLSASRMLPFVDTLGLAVDKLRAALPRQRQAELDRLRGALAFTGVPAHHVDSKTRAVVEEAWFQDRPLNIVYRPSTRAQPTPRRVQIRTLVMTRSETLLNCDDLDLGEERQFKLHLIADARIPVG